MFETVQSKLVFAFALILLILDVIGGYFMYGKMMGSLVLLLIVVIGIPLALLFAYDINCLVVGNCNVWSWIRTILYLVFVIISIVAIIQLMASQGKQQHKEEDKKVDKKKDKK